MRRIATVLVLLATILPGLLATGWAQDVDVTGAWLLVSTTDTAGMVDSDPLPGLLVFSGTHYSMMIAIGDGPRGTFAGDSPTDEEKLAAYDTFIANSGRYQVSGGELTYRAFMAKNPSYMADWPDNAITVGVHRAGDILHWTWSNGYLFTLQRVEGSDPPWQE